MRKRQLIAGGRYGRLTIIGPAERPPGPDRAQYWSAACDCGALAVVRGVGVFRGIIRSCGCLQRETRIRSGKLQAGRRRAVKYGPRPPSKRSIPTENSYYSMRARCENPSSPSYFRYGARGVQVCERWKNSYAIFRVDMGDRPKGTSINRLDNAVGYCPGNCVWSTRAEQAQNRSTNVLNWDLVNEVRGRQEHGEKQASIATRLGLSANTVNLIIKQKVWRDR